MKQSHTFVKKAIIYCLLMTVMGLVIAFAGFALSGFDYSKYQVENKHWYQVISIPKESIE